MYQSSNQNISIATIADITALKNLLDSAYRGDVSKKGWTTEAHLIAGDTRIDESGLQYVLELPGSVFLKYTDDKQQLAGCVNLQQQGNKIYLGMFCVSPQLQGAGIGKQLLSAAEEYAKYLQCKAIYMTVISARTELVDWYKRHGYQDTGERKPFIEDGITGKHLQPLEFMVLEKSLY